MGSSSRGIEEWQVWIQRMLDRLPAKNRYRRFYEKVDESIPGWHVIISSPSFATWASVPDTADGTCMLDRLHALWADPACSAPAFAVLLRLCAEATRLMAQPVRAAPRQVPVLLGRYELLRALGGGGNGEVFLAWSRETETLYALKLIRSELAADVSVRQSFRREAQTWIRMGDHPNIAKAYFYDEIAGRPMIAMEFVEGNDDGGPSLADKIQVGRLDEEQVARWFVQIADGLAHAYAHGIKAHRDIKPGNILITRDGRAQISDFGIAAPIEAMPAASVGVVGTPHYMSPEQFLGHDRCDVRSDIYSLGITLYQALSGGILPFMPADFGHDPQYSIPEFWAEMRSLHSHAQPRRLETAFWPVIVRSLAKDPAARFADVAQFREALARIATPLGYGFPDPPTAELDVWTLRDQGNTLMRLYQYEDAIRAFDAFLLSRHP